MGNPAYAAGDGSASRGPFVFPFEGHWLIRPVADAEAVPEPLSLLGVATAYGAMAATKRRQPSSEKN